MINVTIINKTKSTLVSITGRVILPTCTLEITDYNASVHYSLHCDSGSFIISPIISKKYKITNIATTPIMVTVFLLVKNFFIEIAKLFI